LQYGTSIVKISILVTTALLYCAVSSLVFADSNRKTDVVILYNGDKITGEVKSLYAGILELDTNAIGTIKIEWQEVARVESIHNYEVRLAEGKRYYGKMDVSDRPGELKVADVYGEHDVSALTIAEIRPVAKSFVDRIDLYLSLGYSYTNASSLAQTTLNTEISYEDERTRNALTGRMVITDTDESVTRSSKVDLSRSVWTDRQDTYRIILGGYETNDELGLDYRVSVGAGLGRYFTDTHKSTWTGALGLQVLTEKDLLGLTQESVEGVITTQFSTWKYSTPELHFQYGMSVYPSVTEGGRVRGDADFKVKWEIVEDFFLDVTAFGTYDNQAAEDSRFDYGLSTSVGWTY
jgi:Protein of unknown function, DUF481